jgi:hypothetical protein
MSFSGRYLLAVLVVFFAVTVSLSAQSTAKQTSKAPRGTVSGRVTIKDKGVAGVTIGMQKSEDYQRLEPILRATTDQDGFYRITNIAAGSYEVMPAAPGFVRADAREPRNKTVIIGEDENVEGINFALVRGGVITGRVTDADGRPVIEQRVSIYQTEVLDQQGPQRQVYSAASTQTDDRGIYRIFGLSAGRYKVAVGKADDVYSPPVAPTRSSYKQVFHPDVTDYAKATTIEVTEGSEANNVDITLGRPLQTFSASGLVLDAEKGLPVPNMRLGFQRSAGQRVEYVNTPATSNALGEFTVEGLIPGKYGVLLYPNQNPEMRVETMSFDIVDQDVSGLTVRLAKGASLTGVVVLESDDKRVLENLSQLKVWGFVAVTGMGGGFGSSMSSPISPDGSFRLAGLPGGIVNFQLGAAIGPMPPKGFSISRVERDGVVVTPRGLEIKEGEQVTGLRVIVAHGNATIRGVVKVENGSLPEGARFFVRVAKMGEPFSGLRPPHVDARGQFLMEGLTPGVYDLSASLMGGTIAVRPVKKEVSVQDGAVTDVIMTIDLGTTPKP